MEIITSLIAVAKSIYEIYEKFQKDKIKILIEYSEIKNISEDIQSLVKENIEKEIFKSITGINAENPLREKLIKLHTDTKGVISWNQIERTFPYFSLSDKGCMKVNIGLYGVINSILNIIAFIGFIILGNYVIGVYSKDIIHTINLVDFLIRIFFGGLMYMIAGLYIFKIFAIIDVLKIKKYLKNN